MKDDRLYLIHIDECISRISSYISAGKEHFMNDSKTQDAVLRNLHTLAESSQRVSQQLKVDNPTIDWRSLAGFRNVVVHDYLGIDLEQTWDIVSKDIPDLKTKIKKILDAD